MRALWLGTLIGVVTGVAAILFFEALDLATRYILTELTGYAPPHPLGEGGGAPAGPTRTWALPIVVGLGALVSGILVYSLAPEAEGAGADQVIDAFHRRGGRMRMRVIPVKLIASAITIGSGGAAGREGPAAQISGGIGSVIADRLGLNAVERRRALVAGMGAGVGAIFRAPLGGAMMAAEALYSDDFEADAILLSLISSIVAFAVYGAWYDYTPIFGGTAGFSFTHPEELPYYLALGVACGLLGIFYARGLQWAQELFRRLTGPRWVKPAIGGVLVGGIAMFAPEAIHVGYGWVQRALTPDEVMDFSLWLLIALPLLRIVAGVLTVGSGAAGRHLRARDGGRRHARGALLAALPRPARLPRGARPAGHHRDDRRLRQHRPRAPRDDADGGRDDRESLPAGSGDGGGGGGHPARGEDHDLP